MTGYGNKWDSAVPDSNYISSDRSQIILALPDWLSDPFHPIHPICCHIDSCHFSCPAESLSSALPSHHHLTLTKAPPRYYATFDHPWPLRPRLGTRKRLSHELGNLTFLMLRSLFPRVVRVRGSQTLTSRWAMLNDHT
ncbi:hypothetical protein NDA11_004861 [Ustilago hordei]|uniref:Uncharacterized protein n=1 Tax=Ustilago hordei TaxID=120017 RepID=I2FML1_USTHO|nr:hypothetical protein NDA10_002815 [Ustilago hordei]KAJ1573035.1 hypothetical protein NDA12_003551 [Ustilago hordei]KAJ1577560.1 hypothetical protein NDA11_004861 [Ustilago hordei]KAJ1582266.1 hypothetical protein NDA15_007377 [Ustilago hordei]KAJ1597668.1 hypothetical protein NDA14_000054 [Ustilago hordei]